MGVAEEGEGHLSHFAPVLVLVHSCTSFPIRAYTQISVLICKAHTKCLGSSSIYNFSFFVWDSYYNSERIAQVK